jgi:hypothetical protein
MVRACCCTVSSPLSNNDLLFDRGRFLLRYYISQMRDREDGRVAADMIVS